MKARNITPPVYLLLAIVLIIILHFLFPGIKIIAFPWKLFGILPLAIGININLRADKTFKVHATTVKPLGDSTSLVTTGVFGITRNPMYLGFVLILLGIVILLGSLTPYVVVLAFVIFINTVFIKFEEKKLEGTFGQAWQDYRKKVRRWI
jgi:protein-S-isoprenylcysteine O-methyltransferase Ste14